MKHEASDNHVYKVELIKAEDGKRIMRLFETKDLAQTWARERDGDGDITIKRLKVNG